LNDDTWTVAVCEDLPRQAKGPHGEEATVIDGVVRVRRTT